MSTVIENKYDCYLSYDSGDERTHEKVLKLAEELKNKADLLCLVGEVFPNNPKNNWLKFINGSVCTIIFLTENYLKQTKEKESHLSKQVECVLKTLGVDRIILVALDSYSLKPEAWKGTPIGSRFNSESEVIDFSNFIESFENFQEQFENLISKVTNYRFSKSILQRKREEIQAAVASEDTVPYKNFRFMFMGDEKSGKTSTLNKLAEQKLNNASSTNNEGRKCVELQVWKAQEFSSDQFSENDDSEINDEQMKLSVWDFPGKQIFHNLHELYMTGFGICVLVLDANKILNDWDMTKCNLEFWLNSIKWNASESYFMIVVTRANVIDSNTKYETVDERLMEVVAQLGFSERIVGNDEHDYSFFPVENSNDEINAPLLENLKSRFVRFIAEEENGFWHQQIKRSWSLFMNYITRKHGNYIHKKELYAEGEAVGMETTEVDEMIKFYTEAEAIVTFFISNELQEAIFLKPSWLLNALTGLFHDDQDEKRMSGKFRFAFKEYRRTGTLNSELLLHLIEQRTGKLERRILTGIIETARLLFVISKLTYFVGLGVAGSRSSDEYLVPAMIGEQTLKEASVEIPPEEELMSCYLCLKGKVLPGIYERLLCLMINESVNSESALPVVSKQVAVVAFRDIDIFVERSESSNEIKLSISKLWCNEFSTVLKAVNGILQKIRETEREKRYAFPDLVLESDDSKHRCLLRDLVRAIAEGKNAVKEHNKRGAPLPISLFDTYIKFRSIRNDPKPVVEITSMKQNPTRANFDCFLAHDWGYQGKNHERVVNIFEKLQGVGIVPWLDEKHLTDHVSDDIMAGVQKSECVVVFLTENYLNRSRDRSTNVAKEFKYAAKYKGDKMIVAVLEEACLNQKTWESSPVAFHNVDDLYINLCGEEFHHNIDLLATRIKQKIGNEESLT